MLREMRRIQQIERFDLISLIQIGNQRRRSAARSQIAYDVIFVDLEKGSPNKQVQFPLQSKLDFLIIVADLRELREAGFHLVAEEGAHVVFALHRLHDHDQLGLVR